MDRTILPPAVNDEDAKQQQQTQENEEEIATMMTMSFPTQILLPKSRLGKRHDFLHQFQDAVSSQSMSMSSKDLNHRQKHQELKNFSLIVVTDSSNSSHRQYQRQSSPRGMRVLLGLKNRGFGKGYYNAFGGKLENGETPEECACRELKEEASIEVPIGIMTKSKVGIQEYTFEDSHVTMIMHLFRVDLYCDLHLHQQALDEYSSDDDAAAAAGGGGGGAVIDKIKVAGCDEITPRWFNSYEEIPFHQMFADDSLWLPVLLLSSSFDASLPSNTKRMPQINGWYHFQENCQDTNTILHYYMDVKNTIVENDHDVDNSESRIVKAPASTTTTTTTLSPSETSPSKENLLSKTYTLEQRLFHAVHGKRVKSPSVKEFKECWAFCNVVRKSLANKQQDISSSGMCKNPIRGRQPTWDVIIDVAGGHGALAALFLICSGVQFAVVVDPARVGSDSVERAWSSFFRPDQQLMYRNECLRTGLPQEIKDALTWTEPHRILVVACHACSHLTEEVFDISTRYGVHVAAMPCCQKDFSPGRCWKSSSQQLGIGIPVTIDLLQCGRIMGLGTYDVRMKMIDPKITPQNRIILCRPLQSLDDVESSGRSLAKMRSDGSRQAKIDAAHARLEQAYKKAHGLPSQQTDSSKSRNPNHDLHRRRFRGKGQDQKQDIEEFFIPIRTAIMITATTSIIGFVAGLAISLKSKK